MSEFRQEFTEEEHRIYHEQVSAIECGVEGCTWLDGFRMFMEAFERDN